MSSLRPHPIGVALLSPFLAAFLAWGWMELYYDHVVPRHQNLRFLLILVLVTGVGVGAYARWLGRAKAVAAVLAILAMLLAAVLGYAAMISVGAAHGAFS